jgi:cellulose synthase/poly-beta-1,6-N-acetylglucosamine synthase-like glycosyltransferase
MVTVTNSLAFLLAPSTADRVMRQLLDPTFSGIHQLDWFDYALLIPYFACLIILSIYGVHRYETVRGYFCNRKKMVTTPPRQFDELPRVTIQLPMYNERFVVDRLLESISQIDYPHHLLQVQVLDDSTDDTAPYTEALVARYRANNFPIEYLHRTDRTGFKAGALQDGLKTATGEFVAIFDADFVPPKDFILKTIHFFVDPGVGMVQTRWSHLNREYNMLTEVQALLLDAHFVLEHVARCGGGLFWNFNGTGGIMRRQMIMDSGGWQHDTLTEDSDLSYRAQLKGWRFVYLPNVDCPSELPVETYAFQVQQSRWAKGLTQVATKLLPAILKSNIPLRAKVEAFFHLTPNISYPLMIIVSALMLPVMICRFYIGWQQLVLVDLPLVLTSFVSIFVFYLTAQKILYPQGWMRSIFLIPALIAAGIGLAIVNTRAVMEAILGVQSGFVRTPKYNIGGAHKANTAAKYRRKSGWLPFIEIALGSYFLLMVAYAIDCYNFMAIPFLAMFTFGYFWVGFGTLYEEYRDKLRWQRQRRLELETAR